MIVLNMKLLRSFLFIGIFICLFFVFSAQAKSGDHFNRVIWIVFENEDYSDVLRQPDFAIVSKLGVLLTNLKAAAHPSQGNYINMIAGSPMGVVGDYNANIQGTHLGDLLERAGKDWRVYAEGYPGNCFLGETYGDYVRKHVPFLSFTNVSKDPKRCAKIQNETGFIQDYRANSLPEFTMYIPNLKNDGHDTSVDYAGRWLTKTFGPILKESSLGLTDNLFIITFDEGRYDSSNRVYTVLIGRHILAGKLTNQALEHPSLLRLVEDEFQIGTLGRTDTTGPQIKDIWKP